MDVQCPHSLIEPLSVMARWVNSPQRLEAAALVVVGACVALLLAAASALLLVRRHRRMCRALAEVDSALEPVAPPAPRLPTMQAAAVSTLAKLVEELSRKIDRPPSAAAQQEIDTLHKQLEEMNAADVRRERRITAISGYCRGAMISLTDAFRALESVREVIAERRADGTEASLLPEVPVIHSGPVLCDHPGGPCPGCVEIAHEEPIPPEQMIAASAAATPPPVAECRPEEVAAPSTFRASGDRAGAVGDRDDACGAGGSCSDPPKAG